MEKIPNNHLECKELLVNNGITYQPPSTGEFFAGCLNLQLGMCNSIAWHYQLPPEIQPTIGLPRHGRGVHHPWLWGLNAPPLGLADLWRCVQGLGSKKKTKKNHQTCWALLMHLFRGFCCFSKNLVRFFSWCFTFLNFVGTTFSKGWLDVLRSQIWDPLWEIPFFQPFFYGYLWIFPSPRIPGFSNISSKKLYLLHKPPFVYLVSKVVGFFGVTGAVIPNTLTI